MGEPISGAKPEHYSVGEPSKKSNWIEPSCQKFEQVHHVTHIPTAIRIVEDECIHPDLVFDKCRLNSDRIRVVWLSPNTWHDGSRYGNVEWTYDWAKLIEDKNYYWVEAMSYKPPACRILVTPNEHSGLTPYAPSQSSGPWWHDQDSDVHYRNGNYCLEIMFEGDLPITQSTRLGFVQHHANYCNISPTQCSYRGTEVHQACKLFLSSLAARDLALPNHLLAGQATLLNSVLTDFYYLLSRSYEYRGQITDCDLIVKSALNEWGKRNKDGFESLITLCNGFNSVFPSLLKAFRDVVGFEFDFAPE
jgi:hypothetical protein